MLDDDIICLQYDLADWMDWLFFSLSHREEHCSRIQSHITVDFVQLILVYMHNFVYNGIASVCSSFAKW